MAVSGEQANAFALAVNHQAVAVVFDFMQPIRPGRNLSSSRWDARLIRRFKHAVKIGDKDNNANQSPSEGCPAGAANPGHRDSLNQQRPSRPGGKLSQHRRRAPGKKQCRGLSVSRMAAHPPACWTPSFGLIAAQAAVFFRAAADFLIAFSAAKMATVRKRAEPVFNPLGR